MNTHLRERRSSSADTTAPEAHRRVLASLVGVGLAVMSAHVLADKIYVAASGSNQITVLDSTTNQVTASILVSSPGHIAVSPDSKRVYVITPGGLATIDTATNSVIATVPVGPGPAGVALNPTGTRAYVGVQFGSYVAVVDTATQSVIAQTPLPVHLATHVAVSPDGTRVYAGNQDSLVYVIDAATNSIVAAVPVGNFVGEVAVHPAGTYVYAAVINSNTVAVIDSATNAVVAQIPVGPGCSYCGPSTVAVDPLGEFVYAPAQGDFILRTIRTSDHAVVATAPSTGNYPLSAVVHPDGKRLYVTNFSDGTLSVISPQTGSTVATVPVGSQPRGVGVVVTPATVATPTGTDVAVTAPALLSDGSTATTVELNFSQVVVAGQTTITATAPLKGAPPPADFKLGSGNSAYYYDVSTTATFSGSVVLCFSWQEGQFTNENLIKVMHHENGDWVNVTTSVDKTNNVACGAVTSFSPFALFESAYRFTGFFAPVDNAPVVNSVKAGQSIPVKFALDGDQGLGVFVGGGPTSQQTQCTSGAPLDVVSETVAAGSSGLVYDSATGQYVYVWKTEKAWAGTCRQLSLNFNDGSTRRANFLFTK